jgi:8-oxo-dGTP pyrophosphatase MutT (NUDIX family)
MPVTPWKLVSSRLVIRDAWINLRADVCQTAKGITLDPYYVQEPPDWVHIVAFDRHHRVLIIRQYRHGAGAICTEIPSGGIEPGETPTDAAKRELLEETGCSAEILTPLPVLSPNPACYSNKIHAFIATGTRQVQPPSPDETEEIEFEFLPLWEVLALVDAGSFPQSLHTASLLLAMRKLRLLVTAP